MTEKERLLKELDDARALVLGATELLSESDFARPIRSSPWSPADVLNHLTAWDEVAAITVRQLAAGEPLTHWQDDVDGFNHDAVTARRDQTHGEVVTALHDARKSLRDLLDAIPDDVWAAQSERHRVGEPITIPGILRVWTGHDAEHAAELRDVGPVEKSRSREERGVTVV